MSEERREGRRLEYCLSGGQEAKEENYSSSVSGGQEAGKRENYIPCLKRQEGKKNEELDSHPAGDGG